MLTRPLMLALISGILFWISWPVNGLPVFIFLAFVPLLIIEDRVSGGWKFFFLVYLAILIWNVLTTWWVYNSTPVALVAFSANALLQSTSFIAYRLTKKYTNQWTAVLAFPCYWIAFEYVHLSWELSWPWLTLGNVFATFPGLIQWYEYTGVLGGSLWILVVNLSFFLFYKSNFRKASSTWPSLFFLIPIIISLLIGFGNSEEGEKVEVAVIQPNIDPYTQKFEDSENFIPFEDQLKTFFILSDSVISEKTRFLLWPETAIDDQIEENQIAANEYIGKIRQYLEDKPNLLLITGLTTFTRYGDQAKTSSARYYEGFGYYDVFNTAFSYQEGQDPMLYHKSKLVPGVEIMPYKDYLFFLGSLAIDLGGTSGGFGSQKERTVLRHSNGLGLAPSICYESIYGDFMSKYIRNGANAIGIITNDAWWGDTPGYKQHMAYASLRAIELRKSIIRSANTGISGFIDTNGRVISRSDYWVRTAMRQEVYFNDVLTFYAKHGDYLGRIAAFLALAFLFSAITRLITRKKQ